jgi:signal transduction histidine kinase
MSFSTSRWVRCSLGLSSPLGRRTGVTVRFSVVGATSLSCDLAIWAMFRADDKSRVSVDLNELVREVLVLTQDERRNWQIEVPTELDENLPSVTADRVQLQHVLFNLMTNAIDAMESVTDRNRILRVKSNPNGSAGVLITVEDSGIGIAPENINRIFSAFFTTKSHGMGLGLAICRSIVESHGGRLSASPNYPYGAAFEIVLPR